MAEPGRQWWWRVLLVLGVGPCLTALITWIWLFSDQPQFMSAANAFLFGIWGLTAGILCRSLAKALIGLHVGAAMGGSLPILHESLTMIPMSIRWGSLYVIVGVVLGAALNFGRKRPLSSAGLGALAGLVAFTIFILLRETASEAIDERLSGVARLFVVPFINQPPALYLFFWLIVDVLPRREVAREQAANA